MLNTYVPGELADALVNLTTALRDEARKADIPEKHRDKIVTRAEVSAVLANKLLQSIEELEIAVLNWQEGWDIDE